MKFEQYLPLMEAFVGLQISEAQNS